MTSDSFALSASPRRAQDGPAQIQKLWDDIWFGVEASKPAPTRSALSRTEGDLGFFDLDAIRVLEDL